MWQVFRVVIVIFFIGAPLAMVVSGDVLAGSVFLAVLLVPLAVVAALAAALALAGRRRPDCAGKLATWMCLGIGLAFATYRVIIADGAGPSCDGFCFSQTEERLIVAVGTLSYAGIVGLIAGPLAAYLVTLAGRRHPSHA